MSPSNQGLFAIRATIRPMPTKWEPIEYKGKPARRYQDGSIRNDKGHLMARHPKATEAIREALAKANNGKPIDNLTPSDIGEGLALIRGEKQTERKQEAAAAFRHGMLEAVKTSTPSDPNTPIEAWEVYGEFLAGAVLETNEMRDTVSGLKLLAQLARYSGDDNPRPVTNIDKQQVNIVFDMETAELWESRAQLSIEGEVREVSSSEPTDEDGEEEQGSVGAEDAGGEE